MPDWKCPNCGGGFPKPKDARGAYGDRVDECPWCGQVLGQFEPTDPREMLQEQMEMVNDHMNHGPMAHQGPTINDFGTDDSWDDDLDFDEEDEL